MAPSYDAIAPIADLAQRQSDFVTSVGHELRTPLTTIIGFGELLQTHWDRLSDRKRLQHLRRMICAAQRQKHLVEDLLLLTQLDSNILPLQSVPVQLMAAVQHAIDETQAMYPGQSVETEGPPDVYALADPGRTVQILTHIIGNTTKHSPDGGTVSVSWRRQRGTVAIQVRDEAPGIPDHAIDQVFTRFGRLPGSGMRTGHVGIGLGLYLGRRLTRAMGGELELESTGPVGSTFRLRLPAPVVIQDAPCS
jgi:signal transduction histidine kinase